MTLIIIPLEIAGLPFLPGSLLHKMTAGFFHRFPLLSQWEVPRWSSHSTLIIEYGKQLTKPGCSGGKINSFYEKFQNEYSSCTPIYGQTPDYTPVYVQKYAISGFSIYSFSKIF
jgi:hypothetical protein